MARRGRPATGQVIVDIRGESPVLALRFRVNGERHYVRLGSAKDGWTRKQAEAELETVLAQVKLGIWKPAAPEVIPEPEADPPFREFASRWFEAGQGGWRPKTREDYQWQLSHHLLPHFQRHTLSQITVAEVDRYRT